MAIKNVNLILIHTNSSHLPSMKFKIKFRRTTDEDESSSSSSSSSSSETVASIDHLLTCILLRLPMKSLVRFKLVSKQWHSLITDPHFCLRRNPNPNPAVGLFLNFSNFNVCPGFQYISFSPERSVTKPPFRRLNFTGRSYRDGILQSCNGILLCCSFRAGGNRKYYVYNPTVRRFSTLPELDKRGYIETDETGTQPMSVAFDPSNSPHYKVICVRELRSGGHQFEIYSSERGPWRKCGEPFAVTAGMDFGKGVYWNGSVHWLSFEHGYDNDPLCFDLESETARVFPKPPSPEYGSSYYFGESCGHLHYVEMFSERVGADVYEMKRDYSEWFVKYKVDISCVVASYPEMVRREYRDYYVCSVFSVVRGEREEDSFLVLQIPGRVVRYNLGFGSFETLHEFKGAEDEVMECSLRYWQTNGFQHIESLCSV